MASGSDGAVEEHETHAYYAEQGFAGGTMSKPFGTQNQLLSDDEIRLRMKDDPEVQKRVREALARSKNGSKETGVTADGLRDFLREHEKSVDPRPEVPE